MKNILDIRVRRSAVIPSDHKLLKGKIKQHDIEIKENIKTKGSHIMLRIYKLRNEDEAVSSHKIMKQMIQNNIDNIKRQIQK